jgi:hypothetical protein
MRNAYQILVRKYGGQGQLQGLGTDGIIQFEKVVWDSVKEIHLASGRDVGKFL